MTSLWRSTLFSMESLFNCSATVEMTHSKTISHPLKAKTWKTREHLVSLLRDLCLLVLWRITSKMDGIVQMTHLELTSSVLWICNKKRSKRRVLGKCGSSTNRRKNCRNHKTKSEEPWYAPAFFAHWKIITGTSLQSDWKTTENTKRGKGKKPNLCLREVGEDTTTSRSHGGLNDTNLRSHLHLFQKLALSKNCKRHMHITSAALWQT